jgi:hypothetical protein
MMTQFIHGRVRIGTSTWYGMRRNTGAPAGRR